MVRANGLRPHLTRTYKVSKDPAFASKVRDVVGLYLNPPENAIVLRLDEKTQIQALERTRLPLPLRQGRAARHTHDYKRHGVVDLYAALNVATGEVAHACTGKHTALDFVAFMKKVARALAARAARRTRQLVYPRHACREGMAGEEPANPISLHADERVVAKPGRGLLRNLRQTGPHHQRLPEQNRFPRTHRCIHGWLERAPAPLLLDQARHRPHPKSQVNA
jgi:hypothetical protein